MLFLMKIININYWKGRVVLNEKLRSQFQTFVDGTNYHIDKVMGVHKENGKYSFRVWAPHAKKVFLVGDFNQWQDNLPMVKNDFGIWEINVENAKAGELYKFKIISQDDHPIYKIDPFATRFEKRPGDAAVIEDESSYIWQDSHWKRIKAHQNKNHPLNIYEVHAGSWKRHKNGQKYQMKDLISELIPYVKKMGYTHIEFMPLMEHPLDKSWGYQTTGYFAFCESYGNSRDFQEFVNKCHQEKIGVIIDWTLGHYCANGDALGYYDGTPTFESANRDYAYNKEWGTLNFDLSKPEVQSFLISNAFYWIEKFHVDGIRVDAVSNMIYLDYGGRKWTPNKKGGNLNLEAIAFLKKLNALIKQNYPSVLMIAEESSAGYKITGDQADSLNFDYKWNLGWMNDTLNYFKIDPIYRKYHLNELTFSFMYRLSENFILPFSHDEVVHGKRSIMNKMWGNRSQQFAQLRTLYTWMITHPGKKLLFMGSEWGQYLEWRYYSELEWSALNDSLNKKMQTFTQKLNHILLDETALWEDNTPNGLEVIDANNYDDTVLSYIRHGKQKKNFLIIVLNLTPVKRSNFLIGVPYLGEYQLILNSESTKFGGSERHYQHTMKAKTGKFKQFDYRLSITIPSFGALIIKPKSIKTN